MARLTNKDLKERLDAALLLNSTLVSRQALATKLGKSFDGDRDLYSALGYPEDPDFTTYLNYYERDGIATRIVDSVSDETWRARPQLLEGEKKEIDETDNPGALQKAITELEDKHHIWDMFNEADASCGISRYALLFLGLPGKVEEPATKSKDLFYVTVHDEGNSSVDETSIIKEPTDPRFGLPEFYYIVTDEESQSQIRVHYSRVIHIKEGRNRRKNGRLYGVPRLQSMLNRLFDLEKVVGGGSEAFWLLIYRGMALQAKEGMQMPAPGTDAYSAMQDEIEEYMHGLRRYMRLQGVEVNDLGGTPVDSTGQFNVIISYLASASRIPQRILLGSERGQLASSQDDANFADYIDSRRRNFAEPYILRPFIERLKDLGIIKVPDKYTVDWPSLFQLSDLEKADLAATVANAMASASGGAPEVIMPPEEFSKRYLEYVWEQKDLDEIEKEKEENKKMMQEGLAAKAAGPDKQGAPGDAKDAKVPKNKALEKNVLQKITDFLRGKDKESDKLIVNAEVIERIKAPVDISNLVESFYENYTQIEGLEEVKSQHAGPGDHPSGSSQDVHGGKGGGKGKNVQIGKVGIKPLFRVNDPEFMFTDEHTHGYSVAVAFRGENKGSVFAVEGNKSHSRIVDTATKGDTLDNYVRMYSTSKGLVVTLVYAGSAADMRFEEGRAEAMDNIYGAIDILKKKGMRDDLDLTIYARDYGGQPYLKLKTNAFIANHYAPTHPGSETGQEVHGRRPNKGKTAAGKKFGARPADEEMTSYQVSENYTEARISGTDKEILYARTDQNYNGGAFDSTRVHIDGDGNGLLKTDNASHGWGEYQISKGFAYREAASYDVDQMLGLNIVPPTTLVEVNGQPHSLQYWIDDEKTTLGMRMEFSGKSVSDLGDPADIGKLMLLDNLMGNGDRHGNNWLYGEETGKIYAIDNGLTMYSGREAFDSKFRPDSTLASFNVDYRDKFYLPSSYKDKLGKSIQNGELETILRRVKTYSGSQSNAGEDSILDALSRANYIYDNWDDHFTDEPYGGS